MRIDKFLSECGLCTRRESAIFAKRGEILVNGKPAKRADAHIDPEADTVVLRGETVVFRKFTYVMLNKPEGYVSATEDKRLPYVTELLPEQYRRMELFPVGRLDKDTVGLMLLTNDGQLAHALLSPKHHVEKEYRFTAREPLAPDAEERFRSGLVIDGGYVCKSAGLLSDCDRMGGVITLTEGKYHQIKRMLEAIDNRVVTLERISFGGIALDKSLSRGEWRLLSDEEISLLLKQAQNS